MPKDTFFNLPEEKRAKIIKVAIEAFANQDYNMVSISDLVRKAGIAKGSFYQYFEDKKDLYLHLVDLAAAEKSAFFAAHPPPDPEMDVFAYLRWMYTIGVRFEFRNPRMAAIGYRALYGDAPLPEDTIAILRDGSRRFFSELVANGQAKGHIRPEIDPDLAAFIFNAVFTSLGDYIMQRTGIDPQSLADDPSALDSPESEALFNRVVDALELGMGG